MTDYEVWRCPVCGGEIEGETVVDPGIASRIADHRRAHDDHPLYAFRADDPAALWQKGDVVADYGWEQDLSPEHPDFVPVRLLRLVLREEWITLDDPFGRGLLAAYGQWAA